MSKIINPRSLDELKKLIPVVEDGELINTGYIVEVKYGGDIEFKRYENKEALDDESITVSVLVYDNFEEFLKEVKFYTGRKKVYLSKDYAVILLSILNGGEPEDYED